MFSALKIDLRSKGLEFKTEVGRVQKEISQFYFGQFCFNFSISGLKDMPKIGGCLFSYLCLGSAFGQETYFLQAQRLFFYQCSFMSFVREILSKSILFLNS